MLRPHLSQDRLISALSGRTVDPPPIWLMRQAGRYLPEYREVRAKAGSFLGLCLNPELAAEVTLQPLRRFDLDAAIVFSDILMVPYALGQKVEFVEGEGPKLEPVRSAEGLARLDRAAAEARFAPVYETLRLVVTELPSGVPVIGFCGAPWTVATYMVEGAGSKDQAQARLWAYRDAASFQSLIDLLVETSVAYLLGQVKAGARVLQIFDSWAGSLPENEFARWCSTPTRSIVAGVKAEAPDVPIIGFPRGAGAQAETYARETGIDAIGCDTSMPLSFMRETLQARLPVQGNLDPLLLLAGGEPMEARVTTILNTLGGAPFVFNLGHGILPDTPPEHVARLVELVKGKA
ncbi:uroporphyrinogen decarboxylase [Methyloceanibacter sp.]|uniref:uroporphyrinogen decarboxylase n=1 Tax=Methyloceanibacter sp. TaxID=1965321 RepID=UPI003D6DA02E